MNSTSKNEFNTKDTSVSSLEQEIDGCLKRNTRSLKFPGILEKKFNQENLRTRKQRFTALGLIGIVLYQSFCIADRLMLPDIYLSAWKIRFGIVTPLLFLFISSLRVKMFERSMDYIMGFCMTLTSMSIMVIMYLSSHPNVPQYYTGILTIVMCGNIIARLRFVPALLNSLLILALYIFTTSQIPAMSLEAACNSTMVLFSSILTSLIGNYRMEYEERKDYLRTLQDKINVLKIEESNRKLERLSHSDSLTGLFNRRYFDRTFDRKWRSALRHTWPMSLIFIDVDYFKLYNDTYGHQAGDDCLERIGHVIKETLQRGDDFAARYGGEEFIILLSHTGMDQALETAEKIRRHIEAMDLEHSRSPLSRITVSLGVSSVVPDIHSDASIFLKLSDSALYRAKEEGRNRVCFEAYPPDARPLPVMAC